MAGKVRDWRCITCRKIIGTTKAWGFGSKPHAFRCPEHPTAVAVSDLPREPRQKPKE